MKYFVILSILSLVITNFGFPKLPHQYKRTPLGDSMDKTSMKILKETFQDSRDKNVIVSPLGALTLLSIFSAGTEGKSREEIMHLFGTTDYEQLEESYANLTEWFSSMDPSYFVLANKVYVGDKYNLTDEFTYVASQAYKSEVEKIDFSQKKTAADSINKWASEKTKGHIKSPVDENTIDDAAAVALFNVIFFKGRWFVSFKTNDTEEKDFYVDESETVKKPMMKLENSMFYRETPELGARMVELFYKEDGFRMIIVLPDKKDGLRDVVEKLAETGMFDYVFALTPSRRKIAFEMPKFEIKNSLDLKAILQKVGVSHIFREGAPGVVREQAVKVSKAFQEAFVKVDEEGAIAGAFTGHTLASFSRREPPPPLQFKVDHPFMFAILYEDIVLFAGTYTH